MPKKKLHIIYYNGYPKEILADGTTDKQAKKYIKDLQRTERNMSILHNITQGQYRSRPCPVKEIK